MDPNFNCLAVIVLKNTKILVIGGKEKEKCQHGTETKSRGGSNPEFVSSPHLVLELDPRVLQSGFQFFGLETRFARPIATKICTNIIPRVFYSISQFKFLASSVLKL